jgi:hypothetical protein
VDENVTGRTLCLLGRHYFVDGACERCSEPESETNEGPRTYQSAWQFGEQDTAVLLTAEDWLREEAHVDERIPLPDDGGPNRAGTLRAIATEIAELRRERTQWADAYTRLVSQPQLNTTAIAAEREFSSKSADHPSQPPTGFLRYLEQRVALADAAIAAAHEVIGQCDCGMDEPPPNPKKAWHAARDAYWARPSEPPEGHTEDCLSMLTPNGNCDCGLLLRQVRTRNRKADDRQKLLNLLDAVPCPRNHQPVACGCGAYRKALTDALLTAGYRLARAAPPEGQASGVPTDEQIHALQQELNCQPEPDEQDGWDWEVCEKLARIVLRGPTTEDTPNE